MELQGSGIHVSLIEPGPIASRFTANALAHFRANIDIEGSVHAATYRKQLPAPCRRRRPDNRFGAAARRSTRSFEHALERADARAHNTR